LTKKVARSKSLILITVQIRKMKMTKGGSAKLKLSGPGFGTGSNGFWAGALPAPGGYGPRLVQKRNLLGVVAIADDAVAYRCNFVSYTAESKNARQM
jgi:hypothetical protein